MTSIGFVSTSVLESSDGIGYDDERRVESEEVKQTEARALQALNKPLWEQLQSQKDKKKEEYDAVTKLMFAPPKALDEEEAEYLQAVEQQRKMAKDKRKEWESKEVEMFAMARANQILSKTSHEKEVDYAERQSEGAATDVKGNHHTATTVKAPTFIIKVKPKSSAKRKKSGGDESKEKSKKGKPSLCRAGEEVAAPKVTDDDTPGENLLGLGGYYSDSD